MMSIILGLPYIVEKTAAHLFGVPHGHKHCVSSAEMVIAVVSGEPKPAHLPE